MKTYLVFDLKSESFAARNLIGTAVTNELPLSPGFYFKRVDVTMPAYFLAGGVKECLGLYYKEQKFPVTVYWEIKDVQAV